MHVLHVQIKAPVEQNRVVPLALNMRTMLSTLVGILILLQHDCHYSFHLSTVEEAR